MNKKKLMIILIGATVLLCAIIGIGVSGVLNPYEHQIRIGYKLLDEGNYEEAILAFDKAIQIDEKRDSAYIGKADVYTTRCDDNAFEDTKAVIQTGYGYHYNDESFVTAIIRLADRFGDNDRRSWAIEFLNFGYELTGDERIKEHKRELINKIVGLILSDLYTMFENGDEENIKQEIQSEKYVEFMKYIEDEDYKYIYFPDTVENQTGKGMALYYFNSAKYGNIFVYYGDFAEGKRQGKGTWVGAKDKQFYWFEGEWSGDAPNGYGDVREWREELNAGMVVRNLKGNLVNGLWDGDMNWNFVYADKTDENILSFIGGHSKVTEVESGTSNPYRISAISDGEDSGMWFTYSPEEYTYGIIGFDDAGLMAET